MTKHSCNCCCCKCRPQYIYYDTISANDWLRQQYEDWLKGQQSTVAIEEPNPDIQWRFKMGDITPKQGIQTYSRHIQDGACQYEKSKSAFDIYKDNNTIENTYRQFGVDWSM
jgi:hypothetical protein